MDIDSRMGAHARLETVPTDVQRSWPDMGRALLRSVPSLLPHAMTIEELQHMLSKISTMKVESRGPVREKLMELEYEVKVEMNRIRSLQGKPPVY